MTHERVERGPKAWPHRGMAVGNRRHSGSRDLGETEGSPDEGGDASSSSL